MRTNFLFFISKIDDRFEATMKRYFPLRQEIDRTQSEYRRLSPVHRYSKMRSEREVELCPDKR